MDNRYQWTARLAAVLAGQLTPAARSAALNDLAATHVTGQDQIDMTRRRILHLMAQQDLAGDGVSALSQPLGTLPEAVPDDVSLVTVDLGNFGLAALRNWLRLGVKEVVLVDVHTTPALAHRLREAGLNDPRITLIRLDSVEVTWMQAFNIGLRAAHHARLWAISASTRLAALAQLPPLRQGSYAFDPGKSDAAGFLLDLNRADLAAAGGFNEYLESPAWAVEDLAARLSAIGLIRATLSPDLLTPGTKAIDQTVSTSGTLRDTLLHAPNFAALQNRFIAAAMPDWTGAAQLPCVFLDQDELGRHVQPQPATVAKVPLHIKTEAATHALIDLMRDRLGGQPERLSPRRLDMVLARPVGDVSAVDITVAASNAPETVKTRKAWLVLDVAADSLPLPGTQTARALKSLLALAETQGQTSVLRFDSPFFGLFPCPMVTGPLITTFWPTEVRELAKPLGDRAPRHARMPFNAQTVADMQTLAQSPALVMRRPKIFIDAQHGLGNRMRAIASAGAIAAGTDRELVIIWQRDVHCDCDHADLFLPSGAVLTQGFAPEATAMGLQLFNYMEIEPGSRKDASIAMGAFQDVYIRSAYPLVSPCANWHTEHAWITNLQPNAVVLDLVASVRTPNDLSVHIRMAGGAAVQHLPYESAANWTEAAHDQIEHWRNRSHFKHFLPRLDQLIASGLADTVFLATDTPAIQAEFELLYGSRVTWLPRPASDRSAQGITYALADAILLSRAPRLLGSTWSSFSELAARLSPEPMTVELSGRDF